MLFLSEDLLKMRMPRKCEQMDPTRTLACFDTFFTKIDESECQFSPWRVLRPWRTDYKEVFFG